MTLSITKYYETFIILIFIFRNHRWCSFSFWSFYIFIFSNLLVLNLNDKEICKNNSSISALFKFSNVNDWIFINCASMFFQLNISNDLSSIKLFRTLSIRRDSFREPRVVKDFRSRYVYVRFRDDSKQV